MWIYENRNHNQDGEELQTSISSFLTVIYLKLFLYPQIIAIKIMIISDDITEIFFIATARDGYVSRGGKMSGIFGDMLMFLRC